MQNNTLSNNFDIQDMISAIYKAEEIKQKLPIGIKVSFDFYQKIKNNSLKLDYSKKPTMLGIPIKIYSNLIENYKFIYNKEEWEDEDAE